MTQAAQTPIEILTAAREALAKSRQDYEQKKAVLDAQRATFDAQHAALIAEIETLKAAQNDAETVLRDAALVAYEESGDKKLIDGVEVKLWDSVSYHRETAEAWCRINMPALLTLNDKAFEKVAREWFNSKTLTSVIVMPAEITEEPKASIARDLSGYLPITAKE